MQFIAPVASVAAARLAPATAHVVLLAIVQSCVFDPAPVTTLRLAELPGLDATIPRLVCVSTELMVSDAETPASVTPVEVTVIAPDDADVDVPEFVVTLVSVVADPEYAIAKTLAFLDVVHETVSVLFPLVGFANSNI